MKKLTLILLALLSHFLPAQDIDKMEFSLEEAVSYALQHNYSVINSGRDLIDAQKQKWETIATGLPQISGAVTYQNQLRQIQSQFPSILVPQQFLPPEVEQGPETFVPIIFGETQTANAVITLNQQIFDGSYIVGVQATKAFLEFSKNNKEKTDLEVRKAVIEAYGNVLLAKESAAILKKNIETLEKTLFETKKIYENGLGDQESVDQLQITLSSVNAQLNNATRLKKITQQTLNLIMGRPIISEIKLTENLTKLSEKQIGSGLIETEFNIENNIDYKLVSNLNQQRFLELKLAKSLALPRLNAFINYGGNSFSDEFNFLSRGQPWFEFSNLGVDLQIPIFSSLRRSASTQRAKIAYEKAKTQLTETEQQIQLQLKNAKSEFSLAIDEYENSKENLSLATRIERKNQIKYKEGIASSFELRQAQTQLYTTQQEYLRSMVNIINRKADLELIINQ